MKQNFARLAPYRQVKENVLIHPVIIVIIVRSHLIGPYGLTCFRATSKQGRRPFVVAWTLVWIPRTRIAGAVVDQVEVWIIGYPAPGRASANLPQVGWPSLHTQILLAVLSVKWLEIRPDTHVRIWPGAVGPPGNFSRIGVNGGQPSADTKLAAAVADQNLPFDNQWRHRD